MESEMTSDILFVENEIENHKLSIEELKKAITILDNDNNGEG